MQIKNNVKLTDAMEKFDVEEKSLSVLQAVHPGKLVVRQCVVSKVVAEGKRVELSDGTSLSYDKL